MINNFLKVMNNTEDIKEHYSIVSKLKGLDLIKKGFVPIYVDNDKNKFYFYKSQLLTEYLERS